MTRKEFLKTLLGAVAIGSLGGSALTGCASGETKDGCGGKDGCKGKDSGGKKGAKDGCKGKGGCSGKDGCSGEE